MSHRGFLRAPVNVHNAAAMRSFSHPLPGSCPYAHRGSHTRSSVVQTREKVDSREERTPGLRSDTSVITVPCMSIVGAPAPLEGFLCAANTVKGHTHHFLWLGRVCLPCWTLGTLFHCLCRWFFSIQEGYCFSVSLVSFLQRFQQAAPRYRLRLTCDRRKAK